MYAAMLRQKPEFRDIKRSNTEYNKYRYAIKFVRECKKKRQS